VPWDPTRIGTEEARVTKGDLQATEGRAGETAEQRFEADKGQIPAVIAFVMRQAEPWDLHRRRRTQLQLALEEAIVNICDYAYEKPPGEIVVRVEPSESRFAVELVDEGVPFDPLAVEEPDLRAAAHERAAGGLGILLVRRVMDEVSYRREGSRNVLRLVIGRT
jgi:serine/threonine-protein kinase RsbW